MKLLKAVMLAGIMLFSAHTVLADEIKVYVDDEQIFFAEQNPVILNDRTFVPLRRIFEALGAYVDWNGETNTVFTSKRFRSVSLTIGSDVYYVDGVEKTLDAPAVIMNERTLIPVRAVSEALGAEVVWDKTERSVSVNLRHGDYVVKDTYIDYWECADDGTVIFTGRTAYPELQTDNAVCSAFNEFMASDADEVCELAVMECLPAAKAAYESAKETGTEFTPYMAEHSFDITYNENDIISVVCADCNFTGGVHPSYTMYAMTYSLATGKLLDCSDVLEIDSAQLHRDVKAAFEEKISKNPDIYYEDAINCLDDALSELKWYLADDGVHFFLNPYEIAPYATGVVEVVFDT